MNIHDADVSELLAKHGSRNRLEVIFEHQTELLHKYHPIEKKNGLLQTGDVPVNLHDHLGQSRLKDFAWRVTEEIAESLECLEDLANHPEGSEQALSIQDHIHEEMSDALHFLIELYITAGVSFKDISDWMPGFDPWFGGFQESWDNLPPYRKVGVVPGDNETHNHIRLHAWKVVEQLGKAMNCLKNKPWKQTQMMTDERHFRRHLIGAFFLFQFLCASVGIDAEMMFVLYLQKNLVNRFRQRSKY